MLTEWGWQTYATRAFSIALIKSLYSFAFTNMSKRFSFSAKRCFPFAKYNEIALLNGFHIDRELREEKFSNLLRPCLYGLGYPRQPSPSRQLYGAFIWSCEL